MPINGTETGRLSRNGLALCRFLLNGSIVGAAKILRYPRESPQLMYQALLLMVRREVGRDTGRYVRDVLTADNSSSAERIDLGERLLESVLVPRRPPLARVPRRHQDLLPLLLIAMVRDANMSPSDVAALVETAETRLGRLRRKSRDAEDGAVAFRWKFWRRGTERPLPADPSYEAVGPRTATGNVLRALVDFNTKRARSFPEEPADDAAAAIVDAAFRLAVEGQFSTSPDRGRVVSFVDGIDRSNLDLSEGELVGLIMEAPVSGDAHEGVDAESHLAAKTVVLVELCEAFGLFGREVDGLIKQAEEAVAAAGYSPRII